MRKAIACGIVFILIGVIGLIYSFIKKEGVIKEKVKSKKGKKK